VGIGEFFLIITVVFLLFKPSELPTLFVVGGKILRKIRKFSVMISDYLENTVQQEEIKQYEKRARQQVMNKEKKENARKKNSS
jgi:Sec-independent protein translocase protein TatA